MREEFADWLKEAFDKAAQSYAAKRFESLTEEEWATIRHYQSMVEQVSEASKSRVIDALRLLSAVENGFQPSEWAKSMLRTLARCLKNMGLELRDILSSESVSPEISLRDVMKAEEFLQALEKDNEAAFWEGCYYNSLGEWTIARQYYNDALAGSLNRRMRFTAVQNRAWCCVYLGEWDKALAAYDELKEFAKIPDTKELAEGCTGYIRALRDYDISPERAFILAPAPEEFEESTAVREAEQILEAAAKGASYLEQFSPLDHLIKEKKAIDSDIRKRLSSFLGIVVEDELGDEVIAPLVEAERKYLFEIEPRRAIIDFYDAVACCLQSYVGTKLQPFEAETTLIQKMGVRHWAILLENIDKPTPERIRNESCKRLWQPLRNLVRSSFPRLNRDALKSLVRDLHRVQDLRNKYVHIETEIISGPEPWRQQRLDLDKMRDLVVAHGRESVIRQIISLFGRQDL